MSTLLVLKSKLPLRSLMPWKEVEPEIRSMVWRIESIWSRLACFQLRRCLR